MFRRTPSPLNRSSWRRTAPPAALLALVLAATACSPVESNDEQTGGDQTSSTQDVFGDAADAAQVKPGGTLTVALSADPDKLDPTLSRSLYSRYVFHTMCEKLYDLGPDAKIVPQLATALPTVAADGLSLTIPLREGVKFADGGTLDSAAVKGSIERGLTLAGSGARASSARSAASRRRTRRPS